MARNNFFSIMRYVNSVGEAGALKPDALSAFDTFVKFIESASYTKSKYYKFCSSHWKNSTQEMLDMWNLANKTMVFTTMRSHVWRLNKLLYNIFPYFDADLFLLCKKELLSRMITTVEAINDGYDYDIHSRWVSEAVDAMPLESPDKTYRLDELVNELRAVKCFEKGFVFDVLDKCDMDKLRYICVVFNEPLYRSTQGIFSQAKLDMMLAINDIERSALLTEKLTKNDVVLPVSAYENNVEGTGTGDDELLSDAMFDDGFVYENINDAGNGNGQSSDDADAVNSDGVSASADGGNTKNGQEPIIVFRDKEYKNPYNLVLPKAETERLVALSKRSATESEMNDAGKELDALRKLVRGYSIERFEKILSMANPIDLATVLRELEIKS